MLQGIHHIPKSFCRCNNLIHQDHMVSPAYFGNDRFQKKILRYEILADSKMLIIRCLYLCSRLLHNWLYCFYLCNNLLNF